MSDIIDFDPPKPRRGRFVKGQSGNPADRPPGAENKVSRLRRMIADRIPDVVNTLIEAATAGDVQAARLLLERCLPLVKAGYEPVILQHSGTSLTEQGAAVIRAMTQGEISPDAGGAMLQALMAQSKLVESQELVGRLEALEALLRQKGEQP